MESPTEFLCVALSRVAVGEPFSLKLKVFGVIRPIPVRGQFQRP